MIDIALFARQVYERCDALALHSQSYEGMDRRYLTQEHSLANLQVAQWMELAGMTTWQDEAGNQWGRYESINKDAPVIIMGSHLDTVPNGGKYDGILGVLLPISLVQYLQENDIKLPFHLDIVGFGDEEGTRFNTTLLGSRAVTGNWQEEWAHITDSQGTSIAEAMNTFGLDIEEVHKANRSLENIHAFIEVHIEQGPVLESQDLAVGVVTAIAGARRFSIKIQGKAGHAGTVPMFMRQDALISSSKMIVAIENIANEHDVVATVGRIHSHPNAVNVIPGDVEFSIDVRSENDARRDAAVDHIRQTIEAICEERHTAMEWKEIHSATAVACEPGVQELLRNAIETAGLRSFSLPSGAGHDAMAMAEMCPVGMLFMRCKDGISHHPEEAINVEDIESTLVVLKQFIANLS